VVFSDHRGRLMVLLAAVTVTIVGLALNHARTPRSGHCPRSGHALMVSERHNQAYKDTIKMFSPLPTNAPLHSIPLESHVAGPDGGCLVHSSAEPIFSALECAYMVGEAEEWAARAGGWTSKRHFNHPTTDIPLAELPLTRQFLNMDGLPSRIYPLLANAFEGSLPNWRALRVADAFVVKYNASGGQTHLSPHRDGSVLSFNIALNDRWEYEGGGTWFEGLGRSLPIERGHVCCHASGVLHGGHPITAGVRYILVGFVIVEGYQNWAMRYMKSVWDY